MISSSLTFYRDQKHHDAKIQGEQNLNNLNEDNKWKPDKKKKCLIYAVPLKHFSWCFEEVPTDVVIINVP